MSTYRPLWWEQAIPDFPAQHTHLPLAQATPIDLATWAETGHIFSPFATRPLVTKTATHPILPKFLTNIETTEWNALPTYWWLVLPDDIST